jgi:hypothetical protein
MTFHTIINGPTAKRLRHLKEHHKKTLEKKLFKKKKKKLSYLYMRPAQVKTTVQ